MGETASVGDVSEEAAGQAVMFSCLSCGASLHVDSKAPRLLTCEYCGDNSYIPDALWLRLHPAQRKRPFYMFVIQTSAAEL